MLPISAQEEDPRQKVPHISAQAALLLYKRGGLILVDVHPGGENKRRSVIVGALYIPVEKIKHLKFNLPESMSLGLFCN